MVYKVFARTSHRRDPTAHHLVGPPMVFVDKGVVVGAFYRSFAEFFHGFRPVENRMFVHNVTYVVPMNFTFDKLSDDELVKLTLYVDYVPLVGEIVDAILEIENLHYVITRPEEAEYVPIPPLKFVLTGRVAGHIGRDFVFCQITEDVMYDIINDWTVYMDYSFVSESLVGIIEAVYSFIRPGYWLFVCDEPLCKEMKSWMPEKDLVGMAAHFLVDISRYGWHFISEVDPGMLKYIEEARKHRRPIGKIYLDAMKSNDFKYRLLAVAEYVARRSLEGVFEEPLMVPFKPTNPYAQKISETECLRRFDYAGWMLDIPDLARGAGRIIS